ncbi:MAG: hypothetical protein ACMXYK_05955 [Candidatus Woesearchaeota archaeon]
MTIIAVNPIGRRIRKNVSIFTTGALVGAATGSYYTYKLFDRIDERINQRLETRIQDQTTYMPKLNRGNNYDTNRTYTN